MEKRTTIRLDESLLAEAKRLAIDSKCTFTQLIEDSLRERITRIRHGSRSEPTKMLTFCGGGGLLPGVDFSSNEALQDYLDNADGFPLR